MGETAISILENCHFAYFRQGDYYDYSNPVIVYFWKKLPSGKFKTGVLIIEPLRQVKLSLGMATDESRVVPLSNHPDKLQDVAEKTWQRITCQQQEFFSLKEFQKWFDVQISVWVV